MLHVPDLHLEKIIKVLSTNLQKESTSQKIQILVYIYMKIVSLIRASSTSDVVL